MATTNDSYQLFDTQSPMIHGVNPQTGNFHTYIPIASLVGNNGLGPTLDINLFYSPDMQDLIFKNWALRFSHYFQHSYHDLNTDEQCSLYLSTGEAWSFFKNIDLSSPNFTLLNLDNTTMRLARKDGAIEIFEKHETIIITPTYPHNIEEANYFILKQLISPSGHSLTLNWEAYQPTPPWITPRLISINDESSTLLRVDYSNYDNNGIFGESFITDSTGIIKFDVYPDSPQKFSYEFEITGNGLAKSSKNKTFDITNYAYTVKEVYHTHNTSNLTNITHASGVTETLIYDKTTWNITRHLKTLDSTTCNDTCYTYTDTTTTIEDKINKTKSFHHFNSDHQQTKEIISSGDCKKTIETNTEFINETMVITNRTTYQNKQEQTRTEEVKITLDTLGNPIAKTENGLTTEWTYYRGMPKEEVLVKTETFTDVSGPVGVFGWIGDNLNPIGWGFQLFGKAGLTWGTREIRTVTHDRWVTSNDKSTFNLPVDIVCPGDPNYFKVYVESEKVYTVRNGQRVDLQWTYYGYGDLPVKGSDVKGPAVKPTLKLTVYNPIGDANGRLSSWQNGTMTVEETQYITDANSPHHGRIKSTSQRILDSNGNTVPDSTVDTVFDYSLANGQLTSTTTVTPGNTPALTQKQTSQSLNGQLLASTDTQGNTTTYQYDALGRLTQQASCASDGTPNATTLFSYTDSAAQGSTITRTSPMGEQTRESFDPLGRLSKTERLHADGWSWLTLSSTSYDAQGREGSITEYDYRPDGSVFLSRTRNLSYDDWGAVSRVEWIGGATQGFEYDPVSRQQSQWVTYGTRYSASTTVVIDEPGNSRRQETSLYTNNQLTRSYTAIYDAQGRLIQESSSDAPTRQYAYDAFGRLTRITAEEEVTINEYPAHTLTATASAARIESAGQSITLGSRVIDGLGRVTLATIGGRSSGYTYTGATYWGKASNVRTGEFQQAIPITLQAAYDPNLNLATETTTGGVVRNSNNTTSTVQYTRSLRGILLSETDAFGNSTTFNYDTQGRMTSSSSAIATVNFYYDDFGRLETETLSNNTNNRSIVTRYTYDNKDREVQRKFEAQGFKTLTMTQDYNGSNQIANMALYEDATLLRKETFGYDNKGRLDTYTCDGPHKPMTPEGLTLDRQSFLYDLAGNIKHCDNTVDDIAYPDIYKYDSMDPTQLVSATRMKPDTSLRTYTFTHDSLGYLSNNNGTILKYNTLGKLGSIQSPKGSYDYYYNNLGQLAGCAGTNYFEQFFYQGDYQYARKGVIQINGQRYNRTCVLLNQSSACVLQQNTQSIESGPSTVSHSFEIKDIKGTVIASHNMLDNRSTFFTYTPFGYRPDDWQHPTWIGFNGQPIDRVSGCYPLGNGVRVYNPETQNFQSPDGFSPFGQGGANTRSYCHNDPVNYSDPSGHAEVINQYTVVTHSPAIYDPLTQSILFGAVGVVLAPFTGGASIGWTVATTGLAIVSAGFGIASATLQQSDPKLAEAFGWTALGTGLLSAGTGLLGSKVAARVALGSGSKLTLPTSQRIARGTIYRRGNLPAGDLKSGNVNAVLQGTPVSSTYELYSGGLDSRILYIDAHGTAMASEHVIAPLPTTEFQFRSAPGVKAADVGTSWETRVLGRTPYRHAPGSADIPNYILDEFTVAEHVSIRSLPQSVLPQNYQPVLKELAKQLNADILRPTSTVFLGDLINELTRQGFNYDRIVGNFCRGTMPYNTSPLVQSLRRAFGMF